MHQFIKDFVDDISSSIDAAELHEAIARLSGRVGFSQFAYIAIPRQQRGQPTLISNYNSRWTAQYLRKRYDTVDPVISNAERMQGPFCWGLDITGHILSEPQKDFLEEAKTFGIHAGFTVPLSASEQGIRAITFVSNAHEDALTQAVTRFGAFFHLAAILFQRRLNTVLSSDRMVADVQLTKREFQCLLWASRGKSAWDTGNILGISPRTVIFHLGHVREKLDVRTVRQAVALFAQARNPKLRSQ